MTLDCAKSVADSGAAAGAAGVDCLNKQRQRKLAATLAIGSMALAFLLSLCAFSATLLHHDGTACSGRFAGFQLAQFGGQWLHLDWVRPLNGHHAP